MATECKRRRALLVSRRTRNTTEHKWKETNYCRSIALIKHIRWAIADTTQGPADDPEATVRLPS
jgi:hypothetical protein